jgi:hypothetical protein
VFEQKNTAAKSGVIIADKSINHHSITLGILASFLESSTG